MTKEPRSAPLLQRSSRPPAAAVVAAVVFGAAVLTSAAAEAKKHALLIGIGSYPELQKLGGPVNDVEALHESLLARWGFEAENVTVLLDDDATRRAVLFALDRLIAASRPGDFVFLYYSGHGTSAFDHDFRGKGSESLGRWTGALMPFDYAVGLPEHPTQEEWARGLIVGDRDLRPRLARLDRDRQIFAVFDTCFSGYTVRSLAQGRVRWVSPPVFSKTRGIDFDDDPFEGPAFGSATATAGPFPYEKLIYLAASSRKERAEEVTARHTFDRRTHGALTHALLKGLRGDADTDADGRLTYFELYEYVRVDVNEHHQQMPQLLFPPHRTHLVEQPVFAHRRLRPVTPLAEAPSANASVSDKAADLTVAVDADLAHLERRLRDVEGVRVVEPGTSDYHVRLRREDDGLVALYHPSGDRIAGGYDDRRPWRLIDRLRRQVRVQELIDLTYARQAFDLSLHLPRGQGFLRRGERFVITAGADRSAVFVMLNIDKAGTVSVLYPIDAREMSPATSFRNHYEVVAPYGTEYLKLFAFERAPERLAAWANQSVDALDPRFDELLDALGDAPSPSAETRLKIVTVDRLFAGASHDPTR